MGQQAARQADIERGTRRSPAELRTDIRLHTMGMTWPKRWAIVLVLVLGTGLWSLSFWITHATVSGTQISSKRQPVVCIRSANRTRT